MSTFCAQYDVSPQFFVDFILTILSTCFDKIQMFVFDLQILVSGVSVVRTSKESNV